ncbi:hypothetical protein D3C86_1834000 [compost metagenome]
MGADVQATWGCRALPAFDGHQLHTGGQSRKKPVERTFGEQMTHAGLIRACVFEKQLKHCNDQRIALIQRHRTGGHVGRTPGQTEGPALFVVPLDR